MYWPVDGGGRLPVELSGLPVFDEARDFAGYRGFGVCRDLDGLARLEALRRRAPADDSHRRGYRAAQDQPADHPSQQNSQERSIRRHLVPRRIDAASSTAANKPAADFSSRPCRVASPTGTAEPIAMRPRPKPIWKRKWNPRTKFDGNAEERRAVPSPRRAEIAGADAGRKQRLRRIRQAIVGAARKRQWRDAAPRHRHRRDRSRRPHRRTHDGAGERRQPPPEWLASPEPPARGEAGRDRALLDLLPTGILIYRLDRLLYANPVFLQRMGYDSLHALEQAGGLDALYVEPGVS